MTWGIQRFLVLPYDRLMIHRDTVPMAGDLPVVVPNVVVGGDIEGNNTSQINRPVLYEPPLTHRSTPRTTTWNSITKMQSKKIHVSAPESLNNSLRSNNLSVKPQLPQQPLPPQQSLLLLSILNSLPQADNQEPKDQEHETPQEGSISTSLYSGNTSNVVLPAPGVAVPPSNPMPTLPEEKPSSSQVSTIKKLQHRLDAILFGSQVYLRRHPYRTACLYSHTYTLSYCTFDILSCCPPPDPGGVRG